MTPAQPLLEGWLHLTDAERKELFSDPDHRAAVQAFVQHADSYVNPETGAFTFPTAVDMTLTFSTAAVQAALRYHLHTARALAQIVTVAVGSKRHQAAVVHLINLIHHLSPRVKD
jgi:hypothetical protein